MDQLHLNNIGTSPTPDVLCLLVVLGGGGLQESFLLGVTYEAQWTHSLGYSNDRGSGGAVVGVMWDYGTCVGLI